MNKLILSLTLILLFASMSFGQVVTVEGYAFETNNRGFLNQVSITLLDANSKAIKGKAMTDAEGYFSFEVAPKVDYVVRSEKKGFENTTVEFTTKDKAAGDKVFVKMEIKRQPGYIFDVTLAERRPAPGVPVDAIADSYIEIYNNTTKKEELVKKHHPTPNFNFTFEQGNHYTVMVRKSGFFTKRMEAYVNVEGCILCFDGVGDVRPGVSDVMTQGNAMGTLLANVELDRVELNKTIQIENIYYDLAKWDIRDDAAIELDKLVTVLNDNPALLVELGSHTDSRGRDGYNLDLSEKRANAAVNYLIDNGVDAGRITGQGYGETRLKNKCANGVKCSERRHQLNRRTELKITGILDDNPYTQPSLKEIIEEEAFQRMLEDVQNGKVIEVGAGETPPDEFIKQKLKEREGKEDINKPKYKMPDLPKKEKPTNEETSIEEETVEEVPTETPEMEAPPVEVPAGQPPVMEQPELETPNVTTPTNILPPDLGSTITMGEKNPKEKKEIPVMEKPEVVAPEIEQPAEKKIFSGKDIESMDEKDSKEQEEEIVMEGMPSLENLPSDYSGYRVQLINANSKLPGSHQIFSQHGDLVLEETKDGTFAYLLGDFKELNDIEGFLKHIVMPRYPDAKIIQYLDGKRVVQ